MRNLLIVLFIGVLAVMTYGTVTASMDRSIVEAWNELKGDPWFTVTMYDAYFGFLTFYLWVFYKSKLPGRIGWFIALMLLGNFAIAVYMLKELFKLKPEDPIEKLLLRA